jgi:glycosyltransferase involved in cell wall biosynthesis
MDAINRTVSTSKASPRVLLAATHPIQYQVPLFQALATQDSIDFSVLFMQLPDAAQQGVGFGVAFEWDIPLLAGYRWRQVQALRGKGGLRGFFATRIYRPGKLLRDLRPDVLLLTGWQAWPLVQLLLAARWQGIPVIMRGESNALRQRPWPARLLHRLLLGRCAAFLTIGQGNQAFYRGYGIPETRLFSAPYYIDNARFAAAAQALAPDREALRQRWKITAASVCFLYAGKLEPKKRILDLLQAMHLAVVQGAQPIHLLVVGTGELMPQAQALVALHGLPVTFAGFLNQTEMPAAYVAADCLVLASDFGETWGLVVNEAMACGKPALVSTRAGCGPDLITEGETGAMFAFGDVPALAGQLAALAKDPAKLVTIGANARARVELGYSVARAVAGTLAAVKFVIDRK